MRPYGDVLVNVTGFGVGAPFGIVLEDLPFNLYTWPIRSLGMCNNVVGEHTSSRVGTRVKSDGSELHTCQRYYAAHVPSKIRRARVQPTSSCMDLCAAAVVDS